jgi:hypothetical protein
MNIVQIENRLSYLERYDKKVRDYYNPNKSSGKKHPYIHDLTADYKIDSELYGLGSYWKPEVETVLESPIESKLVALMQQETAQHRRSPEKYVKKVKHAKLRDLELIQLDQGIEKESYKGIFAQTKIAKHNAAAKNRTHSMSPTGKTVHIKHLVPPEVLDFEPGLCSTKLSSVIEANLTSRSVTGKRKVHHAVDTKEIFNELSYISDHNSLVHTLPADISEEKVPREQGYNDILVKPDFRSFNITLQSEGECMIYFKDLSESDRPEVTLSGFINENGHVSYEGSRFIDLSTVLPWSISQKHLKGHTLLMTISQSNSCIFKTFLLLDTAKSKHLIRARNEIKRYKVLTELSHQRAYLPSIYKNKETHINTESPPKYSFSRLAYARNVSPTINPLTSGLYNFKNKFSLYRVNAYPAHLSEYERLDRLTPLSKPKVKTPGRPHDEIGITITGNGIKADPIKNV